MTWFMQPDLFTIGSLTLHAHGLFMALGFTVAILTTAWIAKTEGTTSHTVLGSALVMGLGAIIGSRILYVILSPAYFRYHPFEILKVWEGGLVFVGGMVFGAACLAWYTRLKGLSFLSTADLWVPAVALGEGIGRIGCLAAGCCYGKITGLPWGIVFSNPRSLAPLHVPLHPTQLYASLSGFLIFGILLFLHARKKFTGQLLLWYLILHSTSTLLVEKFRGDYRWLIPGTEMTFTQLISLLILIGSAILLLFIKPSDQQNQRE